MNLLRAIIIAIYLVLAIICGLSVFLGFHFGDIIVPLAYLGAALATLSLGLDIYDRYKFKR